MTYPNNDWLFVSRIGEKEITISNKNTTEVKLATVSTFMDIPTLHLRDYHGQNDNKFPRHYGLSMTRQGFIRLMELQDDILKAFDQLEALQETKQKENVSL